jgi:hypothetical protein
MYLLYLANAVLELHTHILTALSHLHFLNSDHSQTTFFVFYPLSKLESPLSPIIFQGDTLNKFLTPVIGQAKKKQLC